ncbi:MAG: hypothetical protein ACN4GT_09230, partial [Gammaproteobacteria bacterium]
MSANNETRTIPDFVREMPNVDVTQRWERFWEILSDGQEQIARRFPIARHPSCDGRDYYTSPDGSFEGSFNCYSGPELEWLVHSWIGNRKSSLLDMNLTAFLGPQTTVPHLRIIFGTFPRIYFSADYLPRRNLWTDADHLEKYYAEVNDDFLELRSDKRFDWFVSQAPYIRVAESPIAVSISTDYGDDIIDLLQAYTVKFIKRWLGWLESPELVPENRQAQQQQYDHAIRELGYRLDPMNQHFVPAFGADEVERMVDIRMGRE